MYRAFSEASIFETIFGYSEIWQKLGLNTFVNLAADLR